MNNFLVFYIKTTETCNLNCSHCFTNGKDGAKIYFDPIATAKWVNQLSFGRQAHFEFHGGEPFLAPVQSLWDFYNHTVNEWDNPSYVATTNLVYKLTDERLEFMDAVFEKNIGTSWDPSIRFDNHKQLELWEKNVRFLVDRGYSVKVSVSLTRDVVEMEPIDLIKYFKSLGIERMAIERVTSNGNARKNIAIFPTNLETQKWFVKMYEQTEEYDAREWIDNEFMESIYAKFEIGDMKQATFCRNCEQKLFTINADGTVAGCPNSAPEDHYTDISKDINHMLASKKRCSIIAEEVAGDPRCLSCEVYKYCGGDCHQLEWDGDTCPAPKLLFLKMRT